MKWKQLFAGNKLWVGILSALLKSINKSINIRLIMAWQNAGQIQRMNNIQIYKYSVSKHREE